MAKDKDTVKTCTNGFKFTANILDFHVPKVAERCRDIFFVTGYGDKSSTFFNIHIMLDIFA